MKPDRDDTMLDACLAEVLGGAAPPDLSGTILAAYDLQMKNRSSMAAPVDSDISVGGVIPPPVVVRGVSDVGGNGSGPQVIHRRERNGKAAAKKPSRVQWLALAAGVMGLGVGIGGAGLYFSQGDLRNGLATQTNPDDLNTTDPATAVADAKEKQLVGKKPTGSAEKSAPVSEEKELASIPVLGGNEKTPDPSLLAEEEARLSALAAKLRGNPLGFNSTVTEQDRDAAVIQFIDEQLAGGWKVQGIAPSPRATDAEWCRRIYLRILGRIPTAEEAKSFAEERSPFKRQNLVETIQTDAKYSAEYAKHWSRV